MQIGDGIAIPEDELAALCRRYHVRELSLFGSVLRDDFRDDSDVDMLVAFDPEARASYFTLSALKEELEKLLGRSVDLGPRDSLKPLIRDAVLASRQVVYRR